MLTIPFLDFFKGKLSKGQPVSTAPMPTPTIEKPSSERLSKTVMPNSTRTITTPESYANAPAAGPKRPYTLGSTPAAARPSDLPPAVAMAIEPRVERVIAIELVEVANQIPAGWIRPISEAESKRRVLLKAAEVEKGMSTGKPCISVGSIYQQVPEIFLRPVPGSDNTQVPLPFAKVLEEFKNVQQRGDQMRDQSVPQVETPFLKVTLEDNSKFGVKTGPVEMGGELPPVRLEPATAQALADAYPEVTTQARFVPPAPPPPAAVIEPISMRNEVAPPVVSPKEKATPPAPTRIPFKLSPTGPDAPASERVPASSGPSVPSGATGASERIPFKMSPPADDSSNKADSSWLTKENFDEAAVAAHAAQTISPHQIDAEPAQPEVNISLPLRPILLSLPPFQLTGDPRTVPEGARLELPFSLVETQLATGRVSLTIDQFAAALSEEYQSLFSAKEISAPVMLPLQEVLKNLPSASLRMRDDQIEQEKGENFATPFSAKADEDAKRFNLNVGPPKPLKGTAKPVAAKLTSPAPPKSEKPKSRNALQSALETDEELDAKAVVAHLGKMAGVKACAFMFGDGLSLAGNLPENFEADGLCAMAPSLLEKIDSHLGQTKFGALSCMTLSCAQAAVTFFMHGNLCLATLHGKEGLATEVRERLGRVVQELSKKYSNPV